MFINYNVIILCDNSCLPPFNLDYTIYRLYIVNGYLYHLEENKKTSHYIYYCL